MLFNDEVFSNISCSSWDNILELRHQPEEQVIEQLNSYISLNDAAKQSIQNEAIRICEYIRSHRPGGFSVEKVLQTYSLSNPQGQALMSLAEALLRIPDATTQKAFLGDKLHQAEWNNPDSDDPFSKLSAWGLKSAKQFMPKANKKSIAGVVKSAVQKVAQPVIRTSMRKTVALMGKQFVLGETIESALKRGKDYLHNGFTFSFDMLGEAARTEADAEKFYQKYKDAISKTSILNEDTARGVERSSISIKLSALHPLFHVKDYDVVMEKLFERALSLVQHAKQHNIDVTIDAEESYRTLITLDIFAKLYRHESLRDWTGLGIAIQAYHKQTMAVIDWLLELTQEGQRRIAVRLVKGAYWDMEIKESQLRGVSSYPVFTRKESTDLSYLACAKKMLANQELIRPQFATHNAYTVAAIKHMSGQAKDIEFQRLHGMGGAMFDELRDEGYHCRIYAPVGPHEDLLPYLVRRLLENGANSSFVHKIIDRDVSVESMTRFPGDDLASFKSVKHDNIHLPKDMYREERFGYRQNSEGIDLDDYREICQIKPLLDQWAAKPNWQAESLVNGYNGGETTTITSPNNIELQIGKVKLCDSNAVIKAFDNAEKAQKDWAELDQAARSKAIQKWGDLLEEHRAELLTLLCLEAGKTIADAIAELREAVDFCRYYANCASNLMSTTEQLPGPMGERSSYDLHPRGTFVCISPWNFPLAIFTGQIAAALVTGNTVIAKPAELTSLIAHRAIQLAFEAGIPKGALNLVLGSGRKIGGELVEHKNVAGVVFTGSTGVAKHINKTLAAKDGPIVPLIAETGGINAMIVDSSALPEQVVDDIISSSFQSAGQRCSALRHLYVQEDIADHLLTMLKGAMQQLQISDSSDIKTDVGPVISSGAHSGLAEHIRALESSDAKLIYRQEPISGNGLYFAPQVWEMPNWDSLKEEVFGPILHVSRFKANELNHVIDAINQKGFGLTLGIQSRVHSNIEQITSQAKVGNIYINRNTIGAVVGSQPFGGEGLSGTGPKAGGPNYLMRFVTERTITRNTMATGEHAADVVGL